MNTNRSYGSSNMAETKNMGDFQKLTQTIGSNVQKISQNVSSMKKMVTLLETSQDTQELRQQLQKIQQYTHQLVIDTSDKLKVLSEIQLTPDQRQNKMQRERLMDEFTAALNMFQSTQKETFHKESAQVKQKRAAAKGTGIAPPPSTSDPFREEQHANPLIELSEHYEGGKKASRYQIQMDSENLQQLEEQEEALRNLEKDIYDVNEIYKGLGKLVHDQGELVDSIEANIENTHVSVRQAANELQKAGIYVSKMRKKRLYLFIILSVIILILFIYIYYQFSGN